MKTTRLLASAFAAMAFFSCTKEAANNQVEASGEQKDVTLSISTLALSKSVHDEVAPGTKTPIHDATIFFLNVADQVVAGGGTMTAAEAISGKKFCGVSGAAKKVYVVANAENAGIDFSSIEIGSSKAAIEMLRGDITTQSSGTDAMGVDNILLSGESEDPFHYNIFDCCYTACVTVKPAVCIFEVECIKADPCVDVDWFSLDGIYVEKYCPQFTVGGGAWGWPFPASTDPDQLDSVIPCMKDEFCMVGHTEYSPAHDKVWSYKVPVSMVNPCIVFKLKTVVLNDHLLLPLTKYVTVRKFVLEGTSTEICLERGKVYKITCVKFMDVDDMPNQISKNVCVEVKVSDWVPECVDPVI